MWPRCWTRVLSWTAQNHLSSLQVEWFRWEAEFVARLLYFDSGFRCSGSLCHVRGPAPIVMRPW